MKTIDTIINASLLFMMAITTVAIARTRNLFTIVILGSLYSFLMATVLVVLDAVDVAMTEASVGAGITTVLLLSTLYLCKGENAAPLRRPLLPLSIAFVTAGLLIYGTLGLPEFGNPEGIIHKHVAPRYIQDGPIETGVPNMVTAVLASYRGFDTLGETVVIFTGGIGVISLLRRSRKKTKGPRE